MTTLTSNQTNKQRSLFFLLPILLIMIAIVAVTLVNPALMSAQESAAGGSAAIAPDPVLQGLPLSAAAALSADKPILFVFVPQDSCQQRYCRTTDLITGEVSANYGDAINVVHVPVHAIPAAESVDAPDHVYAEWNIYPVSPFRELLPAAEETAGGWGLKGVKVRLVEPSGNQLYAGDEWFDVADLASFVQN